MDQVIAMSLLISTLMLFQIRKISDSVGILAFQSVILSLTAGAMWYKTGFSHLLTAAVLTLLVKAIVIPSILQYTIKKIDIKREVERFTSKYTSLFIALALSVAGFYLTSRLQLPGTEHGEPYLAVSIILIFLGTFLMIDHKKAIMQGIGLITIENGLFLVAESLSYGMPLMVELGIFFDILVTVIVIGILSFRIHSTFESLNTEKMQNLKG
ncbi:hydrogenase [Effusibacillus lacus]|uniref:Hydrogenase n=1 Tax=Effusibacillus lacus TaxID=1348429 RepID=A0A292YD66_9BACL|nr:hydrogenase [Effusibacillus lacus]TCS71216.1 hydrogenase-4 component E [Effusibacillus lacus]GAX89842.1 hydrogenase [Effusibacillus lacus]